MLTQCLNIELGLNYFKKYNKEYSKVDCTEETIVVHLVSFQKKKKTFTLKQKSDTRSEVQKKYLYIKKYLTSIP